MRQARQLFLSAWAFQIAVTRAFAPHVANIRNRFASTSQSIRAVSLERADIPQHRFDRHAKDVTKVDQPCILTIDGIQYNVTAWAKAHPGGVSVIQRFHNKDATKAFNAVCHSKMAHEMLRNFAIPQSSPTTRSGVVVSPGDSETKLITIPRWRQKLFTSEDPKGVHKTLGVFVLLHFAFRFMQMYFGDPSAGLGTRMGKGPGIIAPLCLLPHACLTLSSLLFHTVPRERVVGKPMIWQEYRVHNIAFGLRSIVAAGLSWLSIYKGSSPAWRRVAVVGSCMAVLAANMVADEATRRLRVDSVESTTATMPYWEGCSAETQRKFKTFYAYSQFLATCTCLAVGNPALAFAVLIPIQLASLLMTLVRKGLLSARSLHMAYTISLIMPHFAALRSSILTKSLDYPFILVFGWILFQMRRRGVNKYALWLPVCAARISVGDQFINWQSW